MPEMSHTFCLHLLFWEQLLERIGREKEKARRTMVKVRIGREKEKARRTMVKERIFRRKN